jgi:phosphate transport system substrate-binding protein
MRSKLWVLSISILTVFVSSCAESPTTGDGTPRQSQNINLKGSDTMLQLGQRWAENYMKDHPGTTIQVTGGGSGTGIAALINGTTEICQSSRPMKEEEKASIKEKRNVDVVETPVAVDALAVYVNDKNKVEKLTMEQIKGIFQGKITNWKEVGGADANIVLYGRENNSGTYVFFKEHVLANEDFAERYQPLAGTASVINAVVKDANGIGYGGIGYATDVKAALVSKDASAEPVAPTMENALSNKYPLSRFLFWYTAGAPTGTIKEFVDWVASPQGQAVVKDVGFYPLKDGAAAAQ